MPSSTELMGVFGADEARTATLLLGGAERPDGGAAARLDGYRRGRVEGREAGLAEGRHLAQASLETAVGALRDAAVALEERQRSTQADIARLATALAVELAEAIVGGDLALLETGEDVIVRALSLRRQGEHVRIRVHPDHPALTIDTPIPDVDVVADAQLAPSQAVAEVGQGISDLSLDDAVARVREALG